MEKGPAGKGTQSAGRGMLEQNKHFQEHQNRYLNEYSLKMDLQHPPQAFCRMLHVSLISCWLSCFQSC